MLIREFHIVWDFEIGILAPEAPYYVSCFAVDFIDRAGVTP